MANTKISALTANTNPTWNEEFVYAYNNANWKITLDTMKTFVGWGGGAWITELTADANIWELSEWFYVTSHDLYYKSGSVIYAWQDDSADSHRHMLFVASWNSKNAYLVLTEFNVSTLTFSMAFFWKSSSSSDWNVNEIRDYKYALNAQWAVSDTWDTASLSTAVNQVVSNAHGTSTLSIGAKWVYSWLTYTVYFESVQAANTYSVALWAWVTNPFNVTLPSSSNKQSLITIFMTSNNTWIITWCTIAS